MLGDEHVFKYRQGREQADVLEGTGDALLGDSVRGGGEDLRKHTLVLPLIELLHSALGVVFHHGLSQKGDPPVGGLIHSGDAVEGGGLAGAVGADQTNGFSLVHIEVQAIHGHQAAEAHGQIFCLQYFIRH